MNPEQWRQARQIFEEALDTKPASREAFVRESCHGDQRLFEEVASLLASYDQADDVFLNPVIEGVAAADTSKGRQLGPYRILHRLGQGGMGRSIWPSAADEQFRKRVAVKLVRRGMTTVTSCGASATSVRCWPFSIIPTSSSCWTRA